MLTLYIVSLVILSAFCNGNQNKTNNIQPTPSTFSAILQNLATFVDKSMLLEKIFDIKLTKTFHLFLAPSKFGKTTNLNMIKTYAGACVHDQAGLLDGKKHLLQKCEDIMTLFENTTFQKMKVFYLHFSTFVPLEINLKHNDSAAILKTRKDAILFLSDQVHKAYSEHVYLFDSLEVSTLEKHDISTWLKPTYKHKSEKEIINGLPILIKLLYKHYGKLNILVLIDNYDHIIMKSAMDKSITNNDLKSIIDVFSDQIKRLYQSQCVRYCVMTGVSSILAVSSGIHNLENFRIYKFLFDDLVNDNFGFNKTEVESLYRNSVKTIENGPMIEANCWYGCYVTEKGKELYNPHAILSFLKTAQVKYYGPNPEDFKFVGEFLKNNETLHMFKILVTSDNLQIDLVQNYNANSLYELREYLHNSTKTEWNQSLLFTYFMDLGLVSFPPMEDRKNATMLQIPNAGTQELIFKIIEGAGIGTRKTIWPSWYKDTLGEFGNQLNQSIIYCQIQNKTT